MVFESTSSAAAISNMLRKRKDLYLSPLMMLSHLDDSMSMKNNVAIAEPLNRKSVRLSDKETRDAAAKIWIDPDPNPTTHSICNAYDDEGYASMNSDSARNRFFRAAIKSVSCSVQCVMNGNEKRKWVSSKKMIGVNWLEVGCGASALLTKQVLEVNDLSTVIALELNSKSAVMASHVLAENNNNRGRYRIVSKSSSDALHKVGIFPMADFDAILFEIFGFIASSEGVTKSIGDLRRQLDLGENIKMVPERAATFFAPVELSLKILKKAKGPLYASDKLVLTSRLDFNDCMLSSNFGMLESFDFRDPDSTAADSQQVHKSIFEISKDGKATGLGMFVTLATSGLKRDCRRWPKSICHPDYCVDDLWISSNACDTNAAHSWRNPVILFNEPLNLKKGNRLEVTATGGLGNRQPEFCFEIILFSNTEEKGTKIESVIMKMGDLYPSFAKAPVIPSRTKRRKIA